jgi:hypothetical protein
VRTAAPATRPVTTRPERKGGRVAVRIEFTLDAPQRLFLVVRGPSPSCRTVGVVAIRGRAGENAVRFAGRVGDRRLDPGVYLLTLSDTRSVEPGAEAEAVRVVSPRRTVPLTASEREPTCASRAESGVLTHLPSSDRRSPDRAEAAPEARPAAPLRPPVNVPHTAGQPGALPAAIVADAATSVVEFVVTFGVFALVGTLLLVLLAMATRLISGPRRV